MLEQDGASRHRYIEMVVAVRDRVHTLLIVRNPQKFQCLMMAQNEHFANIMKENTGCCIKEMELITPEILSSLAATRYRLLTSISEYELVNIIARAICELEVPETIVTDVLFETCVYFYTQKKLMKVLRLSSLEQRLKCKKSRHTKTLEWIRDQQQHVFTADDADERAFYARIAC